MPDEPIEVYRHFSDEDVDTKVKRARLMALRNFKCNIEWEIHLSIKTTPRNVKKRKWWWWWWPKYICTIQANWHVHLLEAHKTLWKPMWYRAQRQFTWPKWNGRFFSSYRLMQQSKHSSAAQLIVACQLRVRGTRRNAAERRTADTEWITKTAFISVLFLNRPANECFRFAFFRSLRSNWIGV